MSTMQKRKGSGFELEVVKYHNDILKVHAHKQPLSGALGGRFKGDIVIAGMVAECKRRKKGFTSLYKALAQDDADLLFVRDDHQEPLIVLPLDTYALFIKWLNLAEKFPPENTESADSDKNNLGENKNEY